jgi:hypothetical protein
LPAVIAPLTFGQALAEHVRIIAWRRRSERRIEPDTAELVERYGAAITVIDWAVRLRCFKCGAREATFVISGAPRSSTHPIYFCGNWQPATAVRAIGLKGRSHANFTLQA